LISVLFVVLAGCGDATGDATNEHDDAAVLDDAGGGDAGTFHYMLAATVTHACALRQAGLYCWGNNFVGQLGNDSTQDSDVPVAAKVERDDIVELAVRSGRTCVLLRTGEVSCWGANDHGQIGNGTRDDARVARTASGIDDAVHIAVDDRSTCAVRGDAGTVACWGESAAETPEAGSVLPIAIFGLSNVVELRVGAHSGYCARDRDERVQCWQFRDGGWTTPEEAVALSGARAIGMPAQREVCGLLESGIVCENLDDGSTVALPDSVEVEQLTVSGGALTVSARAPDGQWLLWNVPSFILQAMGVADVAGASTLEVDSDVPMRELLVVGLRACALREDDSVVCEDVIRSDEDLDKTQFEIAMKVAGLPR
jgi:hypothetical protein